MWPLVRGMQLYQVLALLCFFCIHNLPQSRVSAWKITRSTSHIISRDDGDSRLSLRIARAMLHGPLKQRLQMTSTATSDTLDILPSISTMTSRDITNIMVRNTRQSIDVIKEFLSLEDEQLLELLTPRLVKVMLAATITTKSEDLVRNLLETLQRLGKLNNQLIYISIHLAMKTDDTVHMAYTILLLTYEYHYEVDSELLHNVFKKLIANKHISNAIELIDQLTISQQSLMNEEDEVQLDRTQVMAMEDDLDDEEDIEDSQSDDNDSGDNEAQVRFNAGLRKRNNEVVVKPWRQVEALKGTDFLGGKSLWTSIEEKLLEGDIIINSKTKLVLDTPVRLLIAKKLASGNVSLWRQLITLATHSKDSKQFIELCHILDDAVTSTANIKQVLIHDNIIYRMMLACHVNQDLESAIRLLHFTTRYAAADGQEEDILIEYDKQVKFSKHHTIPLRNATMNTALSSLWKLSLDNDQIHLSKTLIRRMVDIVVIQASAGFTTEMIQDWNIHLFMKRMAFLCISDSIEEDGILFSLLIDFFASTALGTVKNNGLEIGKQFIESSEICNLLLNAAYTADILVSSYALVQYQQVLQIYSNSLVVKMEQGNGTIKDQCHPLLKTVALQVYCSKFQLTLPQIDGFPLDWENLLKLPAEQSMAYFLQMIMELISYESFIGKFTESIGWKYDVIMWNEDILRGERNTLNLADQPVVIDFMAKIIHILRNSDEKLSANHKDLRFQVVEAMDLWLLEIQKKYITSHSLDSSVPFSTGTLVYPLCPMDIITLLDAFIMLDTTFYRHQMTKFCKIIMAHLTIKFQAQDGYIYELLHHVKANFQSRSITSFSPLHINMTRSEMMKYYNEIIPFIGKHLEYAERIQPKNEMFDPTSFPRLCTIIAVPIFRKLVLCNPNLQGQVDLYEDQTITKKTTSVSTVLLKLLNTLMPVKNIAKAAKGMVFCDLHDQLSLAQLTQTLLSPEEDLILAGQSREYYLTQGKQFYQEEMSIHLRKRLKEIYTAYPNATITRLATLKMGEFAYHVKMVIMKESVLIDLMLTMAILGHDQDWMQLIIEDCKSMESDTTKRWYASYDDQTLNLFLLAMLTQYVETYSVAANMRKVKDVIEQVISSVSQLASSGSQASQYATDTNDRTSKHKKRHEDKQKGTSEEAASNRFVSAKRKSINHELPWTKDEIIDILQYFDENKVPLHTLFANVGSLLSTINHEVHNEDLTEIINKLKALPANAHAQSFLSSEKARERIRKEDLKIDDVTQFCFGDNRSPLMYKEIYAHILLDRDIPQTAEEAPKAPVKKGFGALKESTARSNTLDDFIEIRDSLKAKFHPDQKLDELQYIAFQNSFSGIGIPYLHLFTMQYNVNVGILDSINLGLLDRLQRKLFPNDDE